MPKLDLSETLISPRETYIDTQRGGLNGTARKKLDQVVEESELESESHNVTGRTTQTLAE
jgi:hypothetical protein